MSNSDGAVTFFGVILWIYGIISQIMTIYFWWQMMKEDSFLMSILVDPFIAEFKGIFWIFFVW